MDLVRLVRPDLLADPEPSWAAARLSLALFVAAAAASAGVLAASLFLLWSRTPSSDSPLRPLPFGRITLVVLSAGALLYGALVRFAWLDRLPPTIWVDEIVPLQTALELHGDASDFANSIRMVQGAGGAHVLFPVLYLEAFRLILQVAGATLFAVRLPEALAGVTSIVTAMLLGRALLPRGGGMLAGLTLAGLRWQLIMSRYAWGIVLVPIVDVATLLLLRARRRRSPVAAAAGGLVAGVGAHVYLAAWIAAAGLAGFLLWPQSVFVPRPRRLVLALCFGVGFLAAASPLFFLDRGREMPYFARASDQSLAKDIRRTGSWWIPPQIVADSFKAPWFLPDPVLRHDLRQSRLGWILGVPFAVALVWALRNPTTELTALLFPHAAAAIAASLRWGFPGHPNGFRFQYLTTLTAVAVASGVLYLAGRATGTASRPVAIAAVGLLCVSGVLGARDLVRWTESRDTFNAYWGGSTLLGRAALRWQKYGDVEIEPNVFQLWAVVKPIRAYRMDPDDKESNILGPGQPVPATRGNRCFRIANPATPPRRGERVVERIRDGWGGDWGAVLGSSCGKP